VIEAAHARGVSVLVVQGERGFCDWDPDMLDAVCWPAAPHQVDALRGMSEGWRDAIAAAGAAGPTVLLGYSNGAFAAARVAVEPTWIPEIETYVIAMGGLQGEMDPMTRPRAALLLRAAEDDPHHRRTMEELSDRLSRAGIGHDFVLREGGHALADSDITAAIDAIVGVNSAAAGRE
jgi:predicted esterase